MTDHRIAQCREEARLHRGSAEACAQTSRHLADPEQAGLFAAHAWLHAEAAANWSADADAREKAAWCQP